MDYHLVENMRCGSHSAAKPQPKCAMAILAMPEHGREKL